MLGYDSIRDSGKARVSPSFSRRRRHTVTAGIRQFSIKLHGFVSNWWLVLTVLMETDFPTDSSEGTLLKMAVST